MRHLVLACFVFIAIICGANAETLPTPVLHAPSRGIYNNKDRDFTNDIVKAQKMLRDMTVGYTTAPIVDRVFKKDKKTKKTVVVRSKVVGHKLADYYIGLAVMNVETGAIHLVRIDRDGENPSGYEVDWNKLNGVNTHFLIQKPAGYVVLALKRVVRIGKQFREVVYTPFSDEIDTPSMRRKGMDMLAVTLERAYTELGGRGLHSHALPDRYLHEIVPRDVALTLSIIEHIDPARLYKETREKLINEVLVVVAANPKTAYSYAVSRAGARGLFQFIPRTYAAIKRQYRSVGLTDNFIVGMNDHVNAAKATLLLFDSDLSALSLQKRREIIEEKSALAKYLAIAYNSGSRRAVHAYKDGTIRLGGLPKETVIYVHKLQMVQSALQM